jgi:hypothetical protein
MQSMYPKVRLVEKTKGGGKEGKKIENSNAIYHIYGGTRHRKHAEDC